MIKSWPQNVIVSTSWTEVQTFSMNFPWMLWFSKKFPWVFEIFPDFSNFPLIFQAFPECCESWVFPQKFCNKISTFQRFFRVLNYIKTNIKQYTNKKDFAYRPSTDILNKHISLTLKQKHLERKCLKEKIKQWLKINI